MSPVSTAKSINSLAFATGERDDEEKEYLSVLERPVFIKTKIVCTVGPSTNSVEKLGELIDAGMSHMRMNFSHGTHEYHASCIANLRAYLASCKEPKQVGIILDTKGPEIRTGKLKDHLEVDLVAGSPFTFYTDYTFVGDVHGVAVSYKDLPKTVVPGGKILVGDGLIGFTVLECHDNRVVCRVDNSGLLGETKGVNLPNCRVNLPAVTEKDIADIAFGKEQHVDFIAASFIRKPSDVLQIRQLLGTSGIKIIAKIENQEGLDNFDAILAVADAIMVARGDLGVEIPVERVARAQKMMIRQCHRAGKPVITATQMLDSMIHNPRPTRAEATDVANAVLDGSDCVMLSGETAKGNYPVETVQTMARICREAELDIDYGELYASIRRHVILPITVSEAIASAAVKTSWDVHATMMIVLTETGNTARSIAKYRPIAPVLAVTANPQTARQVQLSRGVYPLLIESMHGTENVVRKAMLHGVKMGVAERGDAVVVTFGVIEKVSGSTNMMKVLPCEGFDVE